ncbi:MAG: RlmE family RNA methyltransferase [Candidatus Hodarchaeota archaeon]
MAKREDYRSRAAYKLLQLNKKFSLLKEGDVVVDLGAAPGGWLQISKQVVGEGGFVLGVDIQPIAAIDGIATMNRDITKTETAVEILKTLPRKADVVLSDCSPKVSGIWDVDHARQIHLAEASLKIASKILRIGGILVAKVFQGRLLKEFLSKVEDSFRSMYVTKPEASRKRSAEIYVIARDFRGIFTKDS